jgi:hypothetical protein
VKVRGSQFPESLGFYVEHLWHPALVSHARWFTFRFRAGRSEHPTQQWLSARAGFQSAESPVFSNNSDVPAKNIMQWVAPKCYLRRSIYFPYLYFNFHFKVLV